MCPRSLSVIVLIVVAFFGCGAAGGREVGINQPAIVWKDGDRAGDVLDAMRAEGVNSVRLMLVNPFQNSLGVMKSARDRGMSVLLLIPTSLDAYHDANVAKRQGRPPHIYTLAPLSQVVYQKFSDIWLDMLKQIESSNIVLAGVQIENEFNSGAFNGDLPIFEGGASVNLSNYRDFSFWPRYKAGMAKLVDLLRFVRGSLRASAQLKEVPVVLGGLAHPSAVWNRNVGNVLVDPDLALRTLIELGVDQYVDAYAIHLYPQVSRREWLRPRDVISAYINRELAPLLVLSGRAKKWWVTEWGFAKRFDVKPSLDGRDPRLPLFVEFRDALKSGRYSKFIGRDYIYDWSESSRFSIWDGKTVLGVHGFLQDDQVTPVELPATGKQ